MVVITANDSVRALLGDLKERAEIRDDRGECMGYYTPASVELAELRREFDAQYDPDKIRRIKEAGGPLYTTQEVLERLRGLGGS